MRKPIVVNRFQLLAGFWINLNHPNIRGCNPIATHKAINCGNKGL